MLTRVQWRKMVRNDIRPSSVHLIGPKRKSYTLCGKKVPPSRRCLAVPAGELCAICEWQAYRYHSKALKEMLEALA